MAAATGPGLTGNTQSITTTSTVIIPAATYPRTAVIQNIDGTNPIYIGGSAIAVLTAVNGFRLAAGESFSVELPPVAEIYAISGGTVEARFVILNGLGHA